MKTARLGVQLSVLQTMLMFSVTVAADNSNRKTMKEEAAKVRATAAEMNFTKLPWNTDLLNGFKVASEEKRPVFLYLQTGDALDDC